MTTLDELNRTRVLGNAYDDHNLLTGYWNVAIQAATDNQPDLAYEALDTLGIRVMGEDPYMWDGPNGFVACLTFWHREQN